MEKSLFIISILLDICAGAMLTNAIIKDSPMKDFNILALSLVFLLSILFTIISYKEAKDGVS